MEKNRILEGNLYKSIMAFFLPIWFGTFFQQLYNTVDAVIVGNFVGKAALAAVGGPTSTIINLLVGFFVGLSSGAGVVISMYFGSRDIENTDTAIHTAVAVAVTGGAILMIIGIPFSPVFLRWMGTPADVLPLATTYIRIYFIGSIFNLVYNIGSGILRAMGDSKKPLYFLIFASIVNIVLDILFVVVLKMGVSGVAWATIMAQAASAILVIITLSGLPDYIRFEFGKLRINKKMCGEIFRIGIPSGLQSVMFSASNIAIMSSINSFGTDAVAAWTACGKVDAIYWMTVSSFGIANTTFVGQNFGAKNFKRMREATRACSLLAVGASFIIVVVLRRFYGILFRIFTQDAEVIRIGGEMVMIMTLGYCIYVFIETLSGAMRGVGDSIVPTVITVLGICAFRIFWISAVMPMRNQLSTAIYSFPISYVITASAFIIYYLSGIWFKKCARKRFGEDIFGELKAAKEAAKTAKNA